MALSPGAALPGTLRPGALQRIIGISLTSANADQLTSFYARLGFAWASTEAREGPACSALYGLRNAEAQVILLRLGNERLELVSFREHGRSYPAERSSDDPWFQHFAIVVADMHAAYARLRECTDIAWTPITQPAPQRLPDSSGGVTAFKFRDPEGHPLELLEFPPTRIPPQWRERLREPRSFPSPFVGIDHSAIVVRNCPRSMEFYQRQLGLVRVGGSFNRGPEQAALDALPEPRVQVVALAPSIRQPPHLELLCYRSTANSELGPSEMASNDIAATRLIAEWIGPRDAGEPRERLIRDPDGHFLVLRSLRPANGS